MAKASSITTKLTRLLERTADPVYILDAERSILFCNPACAAWIGVEAASLVGRRVDYVAGDEIHGLPGAAAGLCPPPEVFVGKALSGHVSSMSAQGRLLYRRARFMPLVDAGGKTLSVFAFLDHTDLHASDLQAANPRTTTADQLHAKIRQFRAELGSSQGLLPLLGDSPVQKQVRARVLLASSCRSSVLITGPEGSGRAAVARAIHDKALRGGGKFAPLDCGLLTVELLNQAIADLRAGEVSPTEITLLLKDIEQLPAELHDAVLKLVRTTPGPRILATGRLSPAAWAAQLPSGSELAWAVATLEIELSPLVQRQSDLPLVAQALVEEFNRAGEKQLAGLTPEAVEQLLPHPWPGNLQELREVIQLGHAAAQGSQLEATDLTPRLALTREAAAARPSEDAPIDLEAFLDEVQTELIRRALDRAGGNRTQAARLLGLSRLKLYRRMEHLGLATEPFADENP